MAINPGLYSSTSDKFRNIILPGDCTEVLRGFPDDYFSAMVTDPPAGIAFMGKEWDKDKGGRRQWIAWMASVMEECLRVLKPGAHAFVWALPRTSHWTATALEDAGFEIRDIVTHLFGSGFPKSLAIDKAIDKYLGKEREVIGNKKLTGMTPDRPNFGASDRSGGQGMGFRAGIIPLTTPASIESKQWEGYGSALKPASEHWILVRKPISEANLAANVLKWGCGGINIDACRVSTDDDLNGGAYRGNGTHRQDGWGMQRDTAAEYAQPEGRWPANVVMTHSIWCTDALCDASCPIALLDAQGGGSTSSANPRKNAANAMGYHGAVNDFTTRGYGDAGGSSRFFPTFRYAPDDVPFFYTGKASRREREQGCELLEPMSAAERVDREPDSAGMHSPRAGAGRTRGAKNHHPTIKSLALGRWLTRLIGVPECVILDPFCGSGSLCMAAILEGFSYVGIERDPAYVIIARNRIASVTGLWGEAS